jgi:hypothetical protein
MNDILNEELDSVFVRPARKFKEEELAPYTEGSRLLLAQVRGDDDSAVYFVWSFLFMHILIAKNRKDAIRLAWDKDGFRERLLDWILEKTQKDFDAGTEIVGSILDEANKGEVEPIRQEGTQQGN